MDFINYDGSKERYINYLSAFIKIRELLTYRGTVSVSIKGWNYPYYIKSIIKECYPSLICLNDRDYKLLDIEEHAKHILKIYTENMQYKYTITDRTGHVERYYDRYKPSISAIVKDLKVIESQRKAHFEEKGIFEIEYLLDPEFIDEYMD